MNRLKTHVFPLIGSRQIAELDTFDLLQPLEAIKARGMIALSTTMPMVIPGRCLADRALVGGPTGASTRAQGVQRLAPTRVGRSHLSTLLQCALVLMGNFLLKVILYNEPIGKMGLIWTL